ncbi:hypothetical protein BT93_C1850 [Corymbia citriodora subsp. variegata]|nr:hypothetical protein BT93_C1850 [Corymbia citriodora subsp. variegata]
MFFFLLLIGFHRKNSSRKFFLLGSVLHTITKILKGVTFFQSSLCDSEEGTGMFEIVRTTFHEKTSW